MTKDDMAQIEQATRDELCNEIALFVSTHVGTFLPAEFEARVHEYELVQESGGFVLFNFRFICRKIGVFGTSILGYADVEASFQKRFGAWHLSGYHILQTYGA